MTEDKSVDADDSLVDEEVLDDIEADATAAAITFSNAYLKVVTHNRIKRLTKNLLVTFVELVCAMGTLLVAIQDAANMKTQEDVLNCASRTTYQFDGEELNVNPQMCTKGAETRHIRCTIINGQEQEFRCFGFGRHFTTPTIIYVWTGVIVGGAFALIVTAFVNTRRLKPNTFTRLEIEKAYQKTNNYPFIDGLLEIPIARKFGSNHLVTVWVWAFNFYVFFAFGIYQYTKYLGVSFILPSILAFIDVYRMAADYCELKVRSRARNMSDVIYDEDKNGADDN